MKNYKKKIGNILLIIASLFLLFLGFKYIKEYYSTKEVKEVVKQVKLTQKQIDSIKALVEPIVIKIKDEENNIKTKETKREELKEQLKNIVIPDTCNEIARNYVQQLQNCDSVVLHKNNIINGKDDIINKQNDIINKQGNIIEVLEPPKKPKPFGIGLQVGATTDLKEVKPYIGLGVSYNLIRF